MDIVLLMLLLITLDLEKVYSVKVMQLRSKEYDSFLVNQPGCQIPNLPIKFPDIDFENIGCGERYIFARKISNTKVKFNFWENFDNCCYENINFKGESKKNIWRSECMPFENQTIIPLTHEFIRIYCTGQGDPYIDYFLFVKKQRTKKIKNSWNVLILGIDNLSRQRAYDTLVETINFFKEKGWLDFRGFNKVGVNSAPNLIPLLTGRKYHIDPPNKDPLEERETWRKICSKNMTFCNNFILWSKYAKNCYVTAYGEDKINLASNFDEQTVFEDSPTHHYIRPFFKSGEVNVEGNIASIVCTGKLLSPHQLFTYVLDYYKTYNAYKAFGYFWLSSVAHDWNASPKYYDELILGFLKSLNAMGAMDRTFVIFLGDHGMRYGSISYFVESFYESRLPMLFMWVPTKFKESFPELYTNLKVNQGRLISPYDLHLTLLEILEYSQNDKTVNRLVACPTCLSIFNKISEHRSCSAAGIPGIYCACRALYEAPKYEFSTVYSITRAFQYLQEFRGKISTRRCTTCKEFSFVKLLRAHYYISATDKTLYYLIAFVTDPGNIAYEFIVHKYINGTNNKFSYELESAEPISEHLDHGECALHLGYRYLCYCKDIPNCV